MKRIIRLLLIIVAVGALAHGIWRETHSMASLKGGEPVQINGRRFVEGVTYDNFIRKSGQMYDAFSLSPGTANIKDCKT